MHNKFYWEPEFLNIKKVVIIIIAVILLVIGIIVKTFNRNANSEPKTPSSNDMENKTSIFSSNDNSISIELLNSYNLKKYDSDYLLELRSDDNLNIFIDRNQAIENKNLFDLMNKEKENFISTFENSSNISEVKEISINDNQVYTYSFHYLDKEINTSFYLQVMWLQIDDKYYTFDVEFPLDDLSFYSNVPTSILYSFSIK